MTLVPSFHKQQDGATPFNANDALKRPGCGVPRPLGRPTGECGRLRPPEGEEETIDWGVEERQYHFEGPPTEDRSNYWAPLRTSSGRFSGTGFDTGVGGGWTQVGGGVGRDTTPPKQWRTPKNDKKMQIYFLILDIN